MRLMTAVCLLGLLAAPLGGCAVVDVGSAVIGVGATVVSTTVKTTGAVVGGVVHTVTGSGKDKPKSDSDD